MVDRVPQALKGGAAYVFGSLIQRAALFVLLPFLTLAMTPEEFGRVGVALSITQLLYFVLTIGLEPAVIRSWYAANGDEDLQRTVLRSASFVLVVAVPPACLVLIAGLWAAGWPYLGASVWIVMVLSSASFAALTALPLAAMRAQHRLANYLQVSVTNAVVTVIATAVFVIAMHGGVLGWILGSLLGNLVALVLASSLLPWPRPSFRAVAARAALLAIGLPIVPHLASQWGLQLSDRAVGALLLDGRQLGGLALAFNLVVPLLVVATGVAQALQPLFARAAVEPAELPRLRRHLVGQTVVIGMVTIALAGLGPICVELLFRTELSSAARVMPMLAGGTALWALQAIPGNTLSLLIGRTGHIWILTGAVLIAKVAGIVLLVPDGALVRLTWIFVAANVALLIATSALALRHPLGRAVLDWRYLGTPLTAGGAAVVAAGMAGTLDAPATARALMVVALLVGYAVIGWLLLRVVRASD